MLLALFSVAGSPGVSTLALGLAAHWPAPQRALLVEADASGGDLAKLFALPTTPGLLTLTTAAHAVSDPDLVWEHSLIVRGGLRAVVAPPDAVRAQATLTRFLHERGGADLLVEVAEVPGTAVIVDCGRLTPDSPAVDLACRADVALLLTGTRTDDMTHLAAARLPVPHPMVLLVGDGHAVKETVRETGIQPLGSVPDDPRGAALLRGRRAPFDRDVDGAAASALGRTAHTIATVLAAHPAPPASTTVPASECGGADDLRPQWKRAC
ncbi:chromosome partitioning protein [Actinokineospora sp. G85]|uniref:chromosome partitioning protein n=1 Tax=Actinokineospora sp. G85 TaxID=3406626 RepID=UPI003C795A50